MEKFDTVIMKLEIKTDFINVKESDVFEETQLSFFVSRKAVKRAGDVIRSCRKNSKNEEEYSDALLVLKQYRENHTLALQNFVSLIEMKLKRLGMFEQSIISSRVKRLESILLKLDRLHDMQLSRMDDLAGIRVTLPNIQCMQVFINDTDACEILNAKDIGNDVRTNHYIEPPKSDGYRGVHQIFKCKINDDKYVRLELQIRTKIQHEWATAVEILGSLKKVSFKTGQGKEEYRRFLKLSSILFSIEEQTTNVVIYEKSTLVKICAELRELDKKLKIVETLKSVKSIPLLGNNTEAKYYLMQLNLSDQETKILPYNDESDANEDYVRLEQIYQGSDMFDVVLVSVDDVNNIKEAYPNYFLDSNDFISRYSRLLIEYS